MSTTPAGIRVFRIAAIALVVMMSVGFYLVYREAPEAAGATPVIVELDLRRPAPDAPLPAVHVSEGTTHVSLVLPVPDLQTKFDIVMEGPDGITRPSRATSLDRERKLARVVLDAHRLAEAGPYKLTIGAADGSGEPIDYPFVVE